MEMPKDIAKRLRFGGEYTLLSPDEVARTLRTSVKALRRMVRDGFFPPPFRVGRGDRWSVGTVREGILELQLRSKFGVPSESKPPTSTIPDALLDVSSEWQEYSPYREPVVYFLLLHGQVVYIGSTLCIGQRIAAHKEKGFDRVLYFRVPEDRMLAMEAEMIRRFMPPLNQTSNPARDGRTFGACQPS
jgi:predicted DNA-binding transcriptional regulator AlpA